MKTRESGRLGMALLAAAGLLLSLALLGNTGGSCAPLAPPQQVECRTDADCADAVPPLDCDGEFACRAGACEFECTIVDLPCTRDADCGAGEICDLGDQSECCPGDAWCLMYLPVCEGRCVAVPPPAGCWSDADCARGERCVLPPCLPGDPCEGQCVPHEPPPIECWSAADCGPGEYCAFDPALCPVPGCDTDPDCAGARPACGGTCQPVEPPPAECTSDADCGPGARCDLIDCGAGECPEGMYCDWICVGVCVPNGPPPVECWSDYDCAPGERCEIDWTRCPMADCADGADCAGAAMVACGGVCVPAEPPPVCYSDADCGPGMVCQIDDWCGGGVPECDAAGNCGEADRVWCGGVCVPIEPPPVCYSDADCGPGMVCQIDDWCGGGVPQCDAAGNCGEADRVWCGGVCVPIEPPPYGCTSDAECAAGEYCLLDGSCWYEEECDAAGNCQAKRMCYGVCVPYEPPPVDCFSDADCAPGYRCDIDPWSNCGGGVPADCADGADCAPEYWNCVGRCVPVTPPPVECYVDVDCGPGYVCQIDPDCGRPQCPEGYECAEEDLPYCRGVCVAVEPPPVECWSDADCGPGFVCQMDPTLPCAIPDCPAGSECGGEGIWYCGGVCVPVEPPPVECWDNSDCPAGMACEFLYDCAQPYCPDGNCEEAFWGCPGRCVWVEPPPPVECWSDIDCGEGLHCQFDDWCGAPEPCDPADANCGAPAVWCTGVCVPDEPPAGCAADWECAADERCEIDWATCDRCTDERCGGPCLGTCVAIKYCLSDADCPGGTLCDYSDAACFDGDCAPGSDCVPTPCFGECREPEYGSQA